MYMYNVYVFVYVNALVYGSMNFYDLFLYNYYYMCLQNFMQAPVFVYRHLYCTCTDSHEVILFADKAAAVTKIHLKGYLFK